jgi:glyceraldehyde 3-phosphate dehydrogenase
MSTVHAATNSQTLLDTVPKAGATDLRRSRSSLNSIILTSSNAAHALEEVIPEIREIGFMADSVRVPIPTESLIILNLTLQTQIGTDGRASVNNTLVNEIYRAAASGTQKGQLIYSEDQNVPADVSGMRAAVVIEGTETHTRTGFVDFDLERVPDVDPRVLVGLDTPIIHVPVTHAKIFGWYDNEYGSYTNMLGDLTVHVHRSLD